MTKLRLSVAALLLLTLSVTSVQANEVSIQGYSPVAYFTENRPVKGSSDYAANYDGKTYHFQNAEEVTLFEADPKRYAPLFQVCTYSLATGTTRQIDPTNFKIMGGHLLLFHRSDEVDGLSAFKKSELSEEQLVERASAQYKLLKF